jgi:hypothetical protein
MTKQEKFDALKREETANESRITNNPDELMLDWVSKTFVIKVLKIPVERECSVLEELSVYSKNE